MTQFDHWEPTITGWSSDILPFYWRMADALPQEPHVAEVGVYRGRSLLFLAARLRDLGKLGIVHAIDKWDESDEASHRPGEAEFAAFMADAIRIGVWDALKIHRMTSETAADRIADYSLDLVFLDATHTHNEVLADIRIWERKLKPGGILAGHDYSGSFPGVASAVHEVFGGKVRVVDTVWERLP